MIKRKARLIRRKQRRSDIFLSEPELSLLFHLNKCVWIGHEFFTLTKKQLLLLDLNWLPVLMSLQAKGRVKFEVARSKVQIEVIPAPVANKRSFQDIGDEVAFLKPIELVDK